MAEDRVISPLHDAHLEALERAQDALEQAVKGADFDAAELINVEMRERLFALTHVPLHHVSQGLSRLTEIIRRNAQARDDLMAQLTALRHDQRRTQAVIAAYSKV